MANEITFQSIGKAMLPALNIAGKALWQTLKVTFVVLIALLGSGSNNTRKASSTRTSANYAKVRGFSQTKGHWKHEGRMGGRSPERYRHGK